MENMIFCQSCGMPMTEDQSLWGTEADGTKTQEFCSYCYQEGAYTTDDTMEDMINTCIPHVMEANPGLTEEETRSQMAAFFPTLKRWAR